MSEDQDPRPGASASTDVTTLDAFRLTEKLEALRLENEVLKQRNAELESQTADLSQRLTSLTGSSSWRMTRPVRRVIETLRRRRGSGGRGDVALRTAVGLQPGAADANVSPKAHWVLDTKLFNAQAYRELAGLGPVSDLAAAEHYATVGERRGIRPNASFDPAVYADLNREVADTEIGLLIHYAHHGRLEGRPSSFDPGSHLRTGGKTFDPSRKTVLLVCHEASRTGAPILAWNLARQLNRDYNLVIAMLHPEGDLLNLFVAECCHLVGPFRTPHLIWFYMSRLGRYLAERFSFDFAIANSIETQPMLIGLAAAQVPTVTLVHEFPNSDAAAARMQSGMMLSTQVVFDAASQHRSALECWPGITTRNQSIFHQGASEVPADPKKAAVSCSTELRRPSVFDAVRGADGLPVVLGLGTISIRKGVDLFVACAQAAIRRLGTGQVRFVWIGHVPKPHPEGQFMDWLDDQVKRSGLSDSIVFLDAVDDLDGAYAAADVVMISSRLDPFPNVAMDAALAGVPVICFAEANGFADYLAEDARTAALSVPYLDTDAAGAMIAELLRDRDLRASVGDALKERSRRDFPMERYMARLDPVIAEAKAITAQEQRDEALLLSDDTFSPFLWLNPTDLFTREEAVRLHVRKAASGQEANQYCRRPALGFVPQTYADHHPELETSPYPNPLAHWVRIGKPEGPWVHPVLVPSADTPKGQGDRLRAALHVHLHYPELAEGLLRHLAINTAKLDLFVSTTSDLKAADLRERFADWGRGTVLVEACPNRGRDIGPMLTRFAGALQGYDVIGHLHGKRSLALTSVGLSTDLGVQWYEFLLQHLAGDQYPMMDLILDRFADRERLGLVFPEDPNLTGWSKDREIARALAKRMAPTMRIPQSIDFPIGTMFWARPAALKPLFDLNLGWDDYPEEPVPIDGTMLHALERLLPVIAEHEGFDIETTHVPGVTR